MKKKNILDHLKAQAQKAGQKVVKTAKEIADDSGLSTKEGREELLKRTKDLANKTKASIQETALHGASVAKKNVDKSIETVQKKSNQLKEAIKKRKSSKIVDPVREEKTFNSNSPKLDEKTDEDNSLIVEPNVKKTNRSKRNHKKTQNHTATVVGAVVGIAIATTGIVSEFRNIERPDKVYKSSSEHCATYSLEEEYNMMKTCVSKNQYRRSNVIVLCADHVNEFACDKQNNNDRNGLSTYTVQTHCAFFSLEQEYHLMNTCIEFCGNASKCSEKIRRFECLEENSYEEAERKAKSCSI